MFENYKKAKTVVNGFIQIVNESNCKPNTLWVDQGREVYNIFMEKWFDDDDILMSLTQNEIKSWVVERFVTGPSEPGETKWGLPPPNFLTTKFFYY